MSNAAVQSSPSAPDQPPLQAADIVSAFGYCRQCGVTHGLPMGRAYDHCRQLIHHFRQNETIDLGDERGAAAAGDTDPRLSTHSLFGEARGKMFGVLECIDPTGATVILRAFSGQYNGLWSVAGWAPPLFDLAEFRQTNDPVERQIKALGATLHSVEPGSDSWHSLRQTRRQMSRRLMKELHGLYRLHNFRNQVAGLEQAYTGDNGIPTGTGDCCAPKLLNLAARNRLTPVSIAEFFWGLDNKSNTRHHGRFYPSCREKCQPILGYLLCGPPTARKGGQFGAVLDR